MCQPNVAETTHISISNLNTCVQCSILVCVESYSLARNPTHLCLQQSTVRYHLNGNAVYNVSSSFVRDVAEAELAVMSDPDVDVPFSSFDVSLFLFALCSNSRTQN